MKNFINDPFSFFMPVMMGLMILMVLGMVVGLGGMMLGPLFKGMGGWFAPRLATCGIEQMYVGDKVGMPDGDYVITERKLYEYSGELHLTATKINYND